jgi:hypothetical protein
MGSHSAPDRSPDSAWFDIDSFRAVGKQETEPGQVR